ncbi:MAG: CinA family protein [Aeromonadaceae bacterium]
MQESIEALAVHLGLALKGRGWMASTAESCTGGGVAYAITEVPGSSAWFDRSFITYSNEAKQQMLGVDEALLATHGAVSEPVVQAMALGALRHSQAQLSVAISGVAGPQGGSPDKPVGTVWMAWACGEKSEQAVVNSHCFHFTGERGAVREQAILAALQGMCKLIQ